jgi:hypothetical protein
MTRRLPSIAVAACGLLIATLPASAHHSFAAEFDANQPITLQGTVSRIDFVNPHAWLYVDVKESDGSVTKWNVEMGAPNSLIRRGFTKNTIAIGTEVTVTGFRAKDGTTTATSTTVKLPDGRGLFTGTPGSAAPGAPGQ